MNNLPPGNSFLYHTIFEGNSPRQSGSFSIGQVDRFSNCPPLECIVLTFAGPLFMMTIHLLPVSLPVTIPESRFKAQRLRNGRGVQYQDKQLSVPIA